jgi:hypothetical protein
MHTRSNTHDGAVVVNAQLLGHARVVPDPGTMPLARHKVALVSLAIRKHLTATAVLLVMLNTRDECICLQCFNNLRRTITDSIEVIR